MSKIRQRLKQETAGIHQQLHQLSVSKKLLTGDISMAEYAHYLQAHRCFFTDLDQHFCSDKSGFIGLSRCFVDWLESDIQNVGRESIQPISVRAYEIFSSSVDKSLASELGYTYVKFGSMFGAGVILNILQKKDVGRAGAGVKDVQNRLSTLYVTNAVLNQKMFWEQFESKLCGYIYDDDDADRIVDSATKSFEMVFGLLSDESNYR